MSNSQYNLPADLVIEGGGAKIPALLGGAHSIIDAGFQIRRIAGTSAGAIVGSALASGYTPDEIRPLLYFTDFSKFLDGPKYLIPRLYNLVNHKGMYKGDVFYEFMQDVLFNKGVRTFNDLQSEYGWKFRAIAADISDGSLMVLPDDVTKFDMDPGEFEVALAVRASMSIPAYFRPIQLRGHYLVDGGLLSNFPVWLFDSPGEPKWPTFGVMLREQGYDSPALINDFKSYVVAMFRTMMTAHDRRFVRPEDFKHRVTAIDVRDVTTFDFGLSVLKKEELYHSGRKAVNNFLKDWDWEEYKEWALRVRNVTTS